MEDRFVAVVVPLYNKESLVYSCIESLSNQTVLPSFLVVVDDGSTDSSYEVAVSALRNYKGEYTIVRQKNRGVSAARNKGVEISEAKFICFLDADDAWYPDFIERMTRLILDYPEANLFCLGHRVFDPAIGLIKPDHGYPEGFRGYLDDFFNASSSGSVANSSKVAVRVSKFLEFGGFPEGKRVGEDIYVWMMLALGGQVACDSHQAVTVNQVEDNSRKARQGDIPYALCYFAQEDNVDVLSTSAKRYLEKLYLLHFADYARRKDYRGVINLIRVSYSLMPIKVLVSLPILLVPTSVLSGLRNLRRRRRIAE